MQDEANRRTLTPRNVVGSVRNSNTHVEHSYSVVKSYYDIAAIRGTFHASSRCTLLLLVRLPSDNVQNLKLNQTLFGGAVHVHLWFICADKSTYALSQHIIFTKNPNSTLSYIRVNRTQSWICAQIICDLVREHVAASYQFVWRCKMCRACNCCPASSFIDVDALYYW